MQTGIFFIPRNIYKDFIDRTCQWVSFVNSEVRCFTGLANYYRRFVEGYAEMAAPLTALGSPTARFAWSADAQASFDALKLALSSADDGCEQHFVAAILIQPDKEGRQHPVAYESRKLTAAERNHPAYVLELLAVVHALRELRHYLLGGGAARPEGCWSKAAGLTSSCGRTTNDHVAQDTQPSQQDVLSLARRDRGLPLRRDASAWLAQSDGSAVAARLPMATARRRRRGTPTWRASGNSSRDSAATPPHLRCLPPSELGGQAPRALRRRRLQTPREGTHSHLRPRGGPPERGAEITSPRTSMFIALAESDLLLGIGTTPAPPTPTLSADLFLSPTLVQTLATEKAVDKFFWPIMCCAAFALGKLVDRDASPVGIPASAPKGRTFLVRCGPLYRRGQGEADRLRIPAGGGLRAQVLHDCHDSDGPLGGLFGRAKAGSPVRRLAFWVGQA